MKLKIDYWNEYLKFYLIHQQLDIIEVILDKNTLYLFIK